MEVMNDKCGMILMLVLLIINAVYYLMGNGNWINYALCVMAAFGFGLFMEGIIIDERSKKNRRDNECLN